jgi:hypothetical protein
MISSASGCVWALRISQTVFSALSGMRRHHSAEEKIRIVLEGLHPHNGGSPGFIFGLEVP